MLNVSNLDLANFNRRFPFSLNFTLGLFLQENIFMWSA